MKSIILVALFVVLGVNGQEAISPFIINGVRAPIAPYFAFINYFNAENLGFFGGGALVSNRHILTSAVNVQT